VAYSYALLDKMEIIDLGWSWRLVRAIVANSERYGQGYY